MHCRTGVLAAASLAMFLVSPTIVRAEPPVVVFDVPFTAECRDVTPKARQGTYQRKIIEAVVKVSPQLLSGDESDLKRLHYEIFSERQTPLVGFLPSSAVATDVAEGTIAIQSSEHHGNLSFRYLILPTTGDGQLRGDLESSHVQYKLLAPKQVLMAAGTIQRGCGVFYDLRPSKQDTLQKQREFACLFEVPKAWRGDHLTVACKARATKRGFALKDTEMDCGAGLLCVGLYMIDDEEAHAYADDFARKQQRYFDRLVAEAKSKPARSNGLLTSLNRLFSDQTMKARVPNTELGASVAAKLEEDKTLRDDMTEDARNASKQLDAAKEVLRKMNGE